MKKTKLIPITSLDQLEVGAILGTDSGDRCKILAKCGALVSRSHFKDYEEYSHWETLKELQEEEFKLEVTEEPWVPKKGELAYFPWVNLDEARTEQYLWEDSKSDKKLLAQNLVCKTKEEALAKAQKMLDSIKDSE